MNNILLTSYLIFCSHISMLLDDEWEGEEIEWQRQEGIDGG
jgi:hypothetical protein